MIGPGAPAPDFSLRDHEGKTVTLADFAGRTLVLCFYPADFSPVCTDQLAVYQERLGEFEERGAALVGISVDSGYCHRAFREKRGLSMPLLADYHPKGAIAQAYGAYIEKRGHTNRSVVVVDGEGEVRWVHESDKPAQFPDPEVILDALDA